MTTETKRPAFQFYPKEWVWDIALRGCSVAARGLWADLLCLMHEGTPYGHLSAPEDLILRVTGIPVDEYRALLAELEAKGVPSRTAEGVLYSRRMVRDEERRITKKRAGKLGGNPALLNHEVNHTGRKLRLSSPEVEGEDIRTKNKEGEWDAESAFQQLWEAYPAKGRVDYTLSQTYYVEEIRDPETHARALESVTTGKWAKSEKWAKGFIKALPAWLHNRAWETEDPEPVGGTVPTLTSTMDPETRRRLDERRRNGTT